jgi:hypothetical protein
MLDPKEEKRFADLKAMCRELKVPAPPEIMIGLQVHDKNGILTFDDVQRGHSWTRNFYNMLYLSFTYCGSGSSTFGAGYLGNKEYTGTIRNFTTGAILPNYAESTDTRGLLIGTGDTAFSTDHYILATKIAHGNGSGQMAYSSQSYANAYTALTKTWKRTISRIYNNNSGGSITVKECGLYVYTSLGDVGPYLYERSVLSPTVAVANGAQLTVTYEISMDFSAID